MSNRKFSLLIPWFMDGAMALIFAAVPLLALRFGANAMLLGAIGWVPQAVRLPICFTSGHLSEKVGRAGIIVPAACAVGVAAVGLANAQSIAHIMAFSILSVAAIGAFYPPLQAMVGDKSARGELTKNLGAYNIGWCVGGAVMAMSARWLVGIGLPVTFYAAAVSAAAAAVLVAVWANHRTAAAGKVENENTPFPEYPPYLLVISRMGNFTGFFALAIMRLLFPQLGINLGWSESDVATVVGLAIVGQGAGMIAANAGPWWRGKLWPQFTAQSIFVVCGLTVAAASSPYLIGAAAFMLGVALSTTYTAALYHGLASRKAKGKNAGIHESLIAAGSIAGCLLGGILVDTISIRAPYVLFSALAVICIIFTLAITLKGRRKSL